MPLSFIRLILSVEHLTIGKAQVIFFLLAKKKKNNHENQLIHTCNSVAFIVFSKADIVFLCWNTDSCMMMIVHPVSFVFYV